MYYSARYDCGKAPPPEVCREYLVLDAMKQIASTPQGSRFRVDASTAFFSRT